MMKTLIYSLSLLLFIFGRRDSPEDVPQSAVLLFSSKCDLYGSADPDLACCKKAYSGYLADNPSWQNSLYIVFAMIIYTITCECNNYLGNRPLMGDPFRPLLFKDSLR
jgi:hypothetical protein